MKRFLFFFFHFLIIIFAIFLTKNEVFALSIREIEETLNIQINYSGEEENLIINQPLSGVWQIQGKTFPCSPGTPNCEPDRYEIIFPRKIPHIFGLGMQSSVDEVEVSDFIDVSFASGHINNPATDPPTSFEADIGRLRTPVFIFPQENLIIAYLQPVIKKLRLTRTEQTTTVVLKKHHQYPEGKPEPLVIIRGNNLADTYSKYYQFLKSKGFFFKKPHWQAFGLNWETLNEYGFKEDRLIASQNDILGTIIPEFKRRGLKLETITLGTGYWNYKDFFSNPQSNVGTMEVFEKHPTKWPSLDQLINNNWNEDYEIYTLLGMRHHVRRQYLPTFVSLHPGEFLFRNNQKAFLGDGKLGGDAVLFDSNHRNTIVNYFNHLQAAYGRFRGIKEDEMVYADQIAANSALGGGDPNPINLPDGIISPIYEIYSQITNNDFIIMGRNDWFGVGTDIQNGQGWVLNPNASYWRTPIFLGDNPQKYLIKYALDSALTQVVSGYPHPKTAELDYFRGPCREYGIPPAAEKEYIRSMQLATFMPATMYSCGFWHLTNTDYRETVFPFFAKLRSRLHQYAYDQAQRWYETGIPHLLQPLFIRWQDNPRVYDLYTKDSGDLNNFPKNEFMFGNALLIRPLFSDNDQVKVYLPPGKWKPFLKAGSTINGDATVDYSLSTIFDFPAFLKEGEILIIADYNNPSQLNAYVFLENSPSSNIYYFYPKNGGKIRLQAISERGKLLIKNLESGQYVETTDDPYGKGFKVATINSLVGICISCPSGVPAKTLGNANCDGKINGIDFGKWLVVFQNPSASEEEKAQVDFNCQEEQTTHTVDLEDFRIWARNY